MMLTVATMQLRGQIKAQFDTAFVELDAVVARQQLDIKSPLESGANFMDLEGALDVGDGLSRGYAVDAGQPGQGALRMAGLHRQSEVLDLVAVGAEAYQAIEVLDLPVIVVAPYLVSFDEVSVAGAGAYLASMPSSLKSGVLQTIPGGRADVRADIAVPARARHQFDSELH